MIKLFIFSFFVTFSFVAFSEFPIQCEGRTDITYKSVNEDDWHHVLCYKPVKIDWDKHMLVCEEPEGKSAPQIKFTNALRTIYADYLELNYIRNKDTLTLENILVEGNVKILSQDTSSSSLQYAQADKLEYREAEKELTLLPKPGQQVLYYDQIYNTIMRAPKILITQNPETKKPAVQGVGVVHFTFKENELNKFKEHFSNEESPLD
ncbi:MAG: hypothetical protein S4CHLAM7_12610 [Chlamydiae bacterium]|nr:hypothetical protein [Chlamydiota bacterium]